MSLNSSGCYLKWLTGLVCVLRDFGKFDQPYCSGNCCPTLNLFRIFIASIKLFMDWGSLEKMRSWRKRFSSRGKQLFIRSKRRALVNLERQEKIKVSATSISSFFHFFTNRSHCWVWSQSHFRAQSIENSLLFFCLFYPEPIDLFLTVIKPNWYIFAIKNIFVKHVKMKILHGWESENGTLAAKIKLWRSKKSLSYNYHQTVK